MMNNRFMPKLFAGGIIAGALVLSYLWMYRLEVFMAENKPLSEAFSVAYSGPSFDVLRSKCWISEGVGTEATHWITHFDQGDISVVLEGGSDDAACLVDAGKKPAFVIKRKSSYPGYSVFTSGEEMKRAYSLELVTTLISAVDAGNAAVQLQKKIKSSWNGYRR